MIGEVLREPQAVGLTWKLRMDTGWSGECMWRAWCTASPKSTPKLDLNGNPRMGSNAAMESTNNKANNQLVGGGTLNIECSSKTT